MKNAPILISNLSDFPINGPMESLLNYGLSFVPIPKSLIITELKTDIDKYTRAMLWKYFWFENENDTTQNTTQSQPTTQDTTQSQIPTQNTTQSEIQNTYDNKVKSVLKSNKSNYPT